MNLRINKAITMTDTQALAQALPAYTKKILHALNTAGFAAYVVGGAVRDLLLGQTPKDYDIATSARPEQVLALCEQQSWRTVDQLGRNFGCVVIVLDGEPTEVTTFRGESYSYSDAHRPAQTWYCQTLVEDLSRRDFTVNAMALAADGTLIDPYGGQQDLQARLLRTVGNSEQRYQEDALRMFRACRFVAQLDFTYVQEEGQLPPCGQVGTPYYLPHSFAMPVERCTGLSLQRVRTELEKLLLSPQAGRGLMLMMATGLLSSSFCLREQGCEQTLPLLPETKHLLGLHQNPRFHLFDTWEHTLLAVDNSPRTLELRWALLLHDLGKGLPNIRIIRENGQPSDPGHEAESARMARDILTRLRYNERFIELVVWLVAQHMRFAPLLITGERTLLRWVRNEALHGPFRTQAELTHGFELLGQVFLADMGATHACNNPKMMAEGRALGEQVYELARTRMPVCASDLPVSGKELLQLVPQEHIKETLAYLLHRVQTDQLANENSALLQAVRKRLQRHPIEERN